MILISSLFKANKTANKSKLNGTLFDVGNARKGVLSLYKLRMSLTIPVLPLIYTIIV